MNKINFYFFLLMVMPFFLSAQVQPFKTATPESMKISGDSLNKMIHHFHGLVDGNQLAGIQTGILRKGKLIHFDSYGYSNIEAKEELNEESIFRIFSMTKPIVSVALMQLFEQGKFKLEDPLHLHLPMFKGSKIYSDTGLISTEHPIKIIHILTHTSGFSYGRGENQTLNQMYIDANLLNSPSNKVFAEKLSDIPLQFEPGTNWQYGLSTNICGYLIEALSGMRLDEYLTKFVLGPLQMNDTHFQLPKEKINRFTVGYAWGENELLVAEETKTSRFVQDMTLMNGGGGLVSTTLDYLKFCQMLLNRGTFRGQRILNKETVDLMLRDHVSQAREIQGRLRLPLGEAGFGLGFAIRGEGNELNPVFGWGGAVGTYFKIDTENDLAYVLMIQLSPYRHLQLRELFQGFVNASIFN